MSNDLDLYSNGGQIVTTPGQDLYQPSPADTWGNTEIDYLGGNQQHQTGRVQLFGTPLPAGATAEHVERALGEIAEVFTADMSRLNHPMKFSTAAVQWLQQTAMQPPRREQKRHNYNLHDQAGDPVAESFGNAMARAGASQEFVSNALWWIAELERQQNNGSGHDRPQATDGPITSGDPLDSLSDDQYAQVVAINDRAKAQTMDYLRDLWGSSFHANIRMVNSYFQSLPQHEQEYLGQMTSGWVSGLNTREIILGLYQQSIGAASISNSGSGVADEIAAIENLMRTDKKAYLKDDRLQARLRELYRRRDG